MLLTTYKRERHSKPSLQDAVQFSSLIAHIECRFGERMRLKNKTFVILRCIQNLKNGHRKLNVLKKMPIKEKRCGRCLMKGVSRQREAF